MFELTEEQRRELTGPEPATAIDPATKQTYVLVRTEEYTQFAVTASRGRDDHAAATISDGIKRSQVAFWRDLPHLLQKRGHLGYWVAYHHDKRVGIAADGSQLLRALHEKGIAGEDYYLGVIEPRDLPPWAEEEIEPIHPQHFEDN